MPSALSETARERVVLAVLVAASAAVLWPLRPYGLQMGNDGWLLHPAVRMQEGEVLYRDVLTYYAPLRYHLFERVFALFGPSFLLSRTVWVLMFVASAALAFRLCLRLLPVWLAWGPPAVYVLAPGPWVASHLAAASAPCANTRRSRQRCTSSTLSAAPENRMRCSPGWVRPW